MLVAAVLVVTGAEQQRSHKRRSDHRSSARNHCWSRDDSSLAHTVPARANCPNLEYTPCPDCCTTLSMSVGLLAPGLHIQERCWWKCCYAIRMLQYWDSWRVGQLAPHKVGAGQVMTQEQVASGLVDLMAADWVRIDGSSLRKPHRLTCKWLRTAVPQDPCVCIPKEWSMSLWPSH